VIPAYFMSAQFCTDIQMAPLYILSANGFGGYGHWRVSGKAANASRRGGEVLPCSDRQEAINVTVSFELGWDGVVDWSLDESPSVGYTGKHKNIFYGLGYSGHGVNLTSIFGRIIADLEAGREEHWKQYPFLNASLEYVPNEPFRWLGAQSRLAWYRLTEP
jgi:hypothetical protein